MRTWVVVGAMNGLLAVALGAFGAHALKAQWDVLGAEGTYRQGVYQTGAQYHMAHALALLLVAALWERMAAKPLLRAVGRLWAAGIVVFSGSLYALAVTGVRVWGAVTPLGGLCFLAGWTLLIVAAAKQSD